MSVAELDAAALQADALLTDKPEPLLLTYWKRLKRHRLAMASLVHLGDYHHGRHRRSDDHGPDDLLQ